MKLWKSDKSNIHLTLDVLTFIQEHSKWDVFENVVDELELTIKSTPEVLVKIIEIQINQNQYEEALANATLLNKITNNHPLSLHYLVLIEYLQGNIANVLLYLYNKQLLTETKLIIARALYINNQLEQAVELINAENVESSAETLGLLSMLYFDLGELTKSSLNFDKALSITINQFDALLAKASYEVTTHNMDLAFSTINKCLEQQSKNGRVLSLLGQVQLYKIQLVDAVNTLKLATEYMPEHIGTWHLLGWAYMLTQQLELAEQAFNTSLNLNPNFAESHGALACVAINKNQIEQAKHIAKKALRLDPHSFSALYANALILAAEGKKEEADSMIKSILSGKTELTRQSYLELIQRAVTSHQNQK